jgi:hypothetical protein
MEVKIDYLNPKKRTLLILDMQNAFIEEGQMLEVQRIRDEVSKSTTTPRKGWLDGDPKRVSPVSITTFDPIFYLCVIASVHTV